MANEINRSVTISAEYYAELRRLANEREIFKAACDRYCGDIDKLNARIAELKAKECAK